MVLRASVVHLYCTVEAGGAGEAGEAGGERSFQIYIMNWTFFSDIYAIKGKFKS
jgi:hypothetical protein